MRMHVYGYGADMCIDMCADVYEHDVPAVAVERWAAGSLMRDSDRSLARPTRFLLLAAAAAYGFSISKFNFHR